MVSRFGNSTTTSMSMRRRSTSKRTRSPSLRLVALVHDAERAGAGCPRLHADALLRALQPR